MAPSTLLVVLAVGLQLAGLVRKEFLLAIVVLLRELGCQRWVIGRLILGLIVTYELQQFLVEGVALHGLPVVLVLDDQVVELLKVDDGVYGAAPPFTLKEVLFAFGVSSLVRLKSSVSSVR